MNKIKFCSNCAKGKRISINNDILCKYNGAVSPNFICSRHKSMDEDDIYNTLNNKCIDCEYFTVDEVDFKVTAMGLCQLFSHRKYDGTTKNPCSKFAKRSSFVVL